MNSIPHDVNDLSNVVLGSAIKVHRTLGPGLLESVYETCLYYELSERGLKVEKQVSVPILYDGVKLNTKLRLDLWIERLLIVEIKSLERLLPIHIAQVMTYLKLTNNRLGLLLNSNVSLLKQGIKRVAR